MAPRFKTLMYQVYNTTEGTNAIICFPWTEDDKIFPFRDILTESILAIGNLCVYKDLGRPLPSDSNFLFYNKQHSEWINEYVKIEPPRLLSRLLKSEEWMRHKEEMEKFKDLIDIDVETSHDFPCIVIENRILMEDVIIKLIEETAIALKVHIPRNTNLRPIRDIICSNRKYQMDTD